MEIETIRSPFTLGRSFRLLVRTSGHSGFLANLTSELEVLIVYFAPHSWLFLSLGDTATLESLIASLYRLWRSSGVWQTKEQEM